MAKRYSVDVFCSIMKRVIVEADNEIEARKMVHKQAVEGELDWSKYDTCDTYDTICNGEID